MTHTHLVGLHNVLFILCNEMDVKKIPFVREISIIMVTFGLFSAFRRWLCRYRKNALRNSKENILSEYCVQCTKLNDCTYVSVSLSCVRLENFAS